MGSALVAKAKKSTALVAKARLLSVLAVDQIKLGPRVRIAEAFPDKHQPGKMVFESYLTAKDGEEIIVIYGCDTVWCIAGKWN